MSKPQVIDDEEHERVHERVAAVDVAKDSGMVCTRLPHPSRPGARPSTVWTVKARMGAVGKLGRQLKDSGIELVTLESTSDYWRIWFFVLEACGLAVQLVNAAQAKNLPGDPGGLFATGWRTCRVRVILRAMIWPAAVVAPLLPLVPAAGSGMSCACSLLPGRSRIRRSRRRSRRSTRVSGRGRWRSRSVTGWASGWAMSSSRPRSGCGAVLAGPRRGWRW